MNSKLLIATHKPYAFAQQSLYAPIHVGKALSENDFGIPGDDTGENISAKNKNFCELTALYWAWKNDYFNDVDYCGLVHYRRYFRGSSAFGKEKILSEKEIEEALQAHDIILPVKRNYYIETIQTHYAHAHHAEDLAMLRTVLAEKYPAYTVAFDILMTQRSLHLYNMFVMPARRFESYAAWLFDILFALEKRIDTSRYDSYQQRVFGFLAERLLNIWVLHNRLKVKTLPVVNMEGENLLLKAYGLLKRKYLP